MGANDFIEEAEVDDHEVQTERAKTAEIERIAAERAGPYPTDPAEVVDSNSADAIGLGVVVELFRDCLERDTLPLGLTRYLLRRATSARLLSLQPIVLANLPKLSPAMPETMRYLAAFKRLPADAKAHLTGFVRSDSCVTLPFVQEWIAWLYFSRPHLMEKATVGMLRDSMTPGHQHRLDATLAIANCDAAWVRSQKEELMAQGPWQRWATIRAGVVLPKSERRGWLSSIESVLDIEGKACVKWCLAQS